MKFGVTQTFSSIADDKELYQMIDTIIIQFIVKFSYQSSQRLLDQYNRRLFCLQGKFFGKKKRLQFIAT